MRIEVIQEDIRMTRSWRRDCPIARAVNRATHNKARVRVGPYVLSVDGKRYDLPQEAQEFMVSFDTMCNPRPFGFDLPLETGS